jgi:hypothetical protein
MGFQHGTSPSFPPHSPPRGGVGFSRRRACAALIRLLTAGATGATKTTRQPDRATAGCGCRQESDTPPVTDAERTQPHRTQTPPTHETAARPADTSWMRASQRAPGGPPESRRSPLVPGKELGAHIGICTGGHARPLRTAIRLCSPIAVVRAEDAQCRPAVAARTGCGYQNSPDHRHFGGPVRLTHR